MQVARWKLTLIAWAAASAGAGAQVTPPSDAGQLPAAPPAPPAAEEAESAEREWRLPPLRLSGYIAYDMRATRGAGEPSAHSHLLTGTVGTSTYIYAPWLATVTGTLGLSTGVTRASASPGSAFNDAEVHDRISIRENFVTGEGRVDLFPRSRFPAEVHVSRQDSRVDSGLASVIQFTRSNLGGSMRYRPPDGRYDLVGTYDYRDQTGLGFRHRQDSYSGDFHTHWKANELSLGGSYNRARSDTLGDDSRFTSLVAQHGYTPSSALSVTTTTNLTRTEEKGFAETDVQVLQLNSVGVYHAERSPLTLTGSVRGLALRDKSTDTATDALGGTLGVNYDVNANLRLSANGGLTGTRSNGGGTTVTTGAFGATYTGDTLQFSNIEYNWFTSGALGVAAAGSDTRPTVTEKSLLLQLGHSASRYWRPSERSTLGLTASQTLSGSRVRSSEFDDGLGRGFSNADTLLNQISLNWQQSGDGKTGYARAVYSDSIELGGGDGRYQLLNFQLSGNFELGYGRTITGDLTYQRSQQQGRDQQSTLDPLSGLPQRSTTSGVSGEVTFRQNQVFGVPRLSFTSRVRLAQDVLNQPGQLLSIPDRETRLWENRLDWNIGRLTTQLELKLSQIDGRRFDSLWLRVQRNFGD